MTMISAKLYTGWVRHRRELPKQHHFKYPVFMTWVDLDKVQTTMQKSSLWSMNKFNLVSFYRQDYIDNETEDIKTAIKQRIFSSTGQHFDGAVCLLSNLRYLGFSFNPVSFYFCFDTDQDNPRFIIAEINNTPWDERFSYVLDCNNSSNFNHSWQFEFEKRFHVSPFMPMDLTYRWQFSFKKNHLTIHMQLLQQGKLCFDATLQLQAQPMNSRNMFLIPIRYPLITLSTLFRIYWQAFLLWIKKIPNFEHPEKHSQTR